MEHEAHATPGDADDSPGLDLPLTEEQRAFAQREVDEQLGHDERPSA